MSIEPTELTVEEGSTATYTAVLNTQSSGDVTVTITDPTDNTDVTTDPASLTFTTGDWDTVAAAQDDDTNDETATVTRYRMGYGEVATAPAVSISVTDTTAGVIISPAAVTVLEGHTAQYTVALKSQPTGNVTVTVNDPRDNTGVTTDPASLTFTSTNWKTAQTVTVTAEHDDDSATLTHTISSTPCLRGSLKAPPERPPSA